ncbi:MAG: alpha/beta hydrolase [Nitrospiraceae bacterium]|nr:alpha/beta hydrolase [Nitrospiraceae bacterium]
MPVGWPWLLILTVVASGCAPQPELPAWFDSVQRVPLRQVTVDGHRIAYLDEGEGSPVILLHGFGGSMWQWEYQQRPLSARFRIITPDLLGSGLSDKPDIAYTPDEMVAALRGFMEALGLERATLVGNSMGGGLAIGMTLTHPERVERLILIDSLPDRVRERLTSPLMQRAIDTRVPVWLAQVGNWLFGGGTTDAILKEIVHDHRLLTPSVLDRSNRNRQRPGLLRPLMAIRDSLPQWESGFAGRINRVSCPTLILWGEHDRLFPPQVGRDIQAMIPGAQFAVIADAGHIPQWERPDIVNGHILSFLAALTERRDRP